MKKAFLLSALFLIAYTSNSFAQINYTEDVTQGCPALTVTFTNTTTEPGAYRFEWQFNDGSPVLVDTLPVSVAHTYTAAGSYYPYVDVYDNSNTWLGWYQGNPINVVGVTYFNMNPQDSVCPNDIVYFGEYAAGSQAWAWNFGDGNTSTQQSTQHTYSATGTYTVTLNVTTQCGVDNVQRVIKVVNSIFPTAGINAYPDTICPGEPLEFYPYYQPMFSSLWNFDDGNTSTVTQVFHSYSVSGTYSVTYTATNGCGNSDMATKPIYVFSNVKFPIGVSANANPSSACPSEQISFYATGNDYVKYKWDFGDGSPLDSSGRNVQHTYTTTGTKIFTCTITNFCGVDSVFTDSVIVASSQYFPNWIGVNVSGTPACPNSNIYMYADGPYAQYVWDYGDGSPLDNTGTDNQTNHTYVGVGTYTASVQVTNYCGSDTTLTAIVQIGNNVPISNGSYNVIANPSPSCPGDEVNIFIQGQQYNSYDFDFGDGSPVVHYTYGGYNHIYNAVGTYTVSVLITNTCGNDTTIYGIVNVTNNAGFSNLNLNTGQMPACPNEPVSIYTTNGYLSYVYNFGDGSPVDSISYSNVYHPYTTAGNYTASVTIYNNCGQDTTLYTPISINNSVGFPPGLDITPNVNPICPGQPVELQFSGYYPEMDWYFGDGSSDTTSDFFDISHSYSVAGTYTVSAVVTNYCGLTTTVTATVNVNSNLYVPNNTQMYVNDSPACPGEGINFNASYGNAIYVWNFGDGSPMDSAAKTYTQHTYSATGTYTASVVIYNYCGNDTTITSVININGNLGFDPNELNTDVYPAASCPNDEVHFQCASGMMSYAWDFGDGNTAVGSSYANHTYTATGTYTATVTMTNFCGNDTTLSMIANVVNNAPVNGNLMMNSYPQISCPNDLISFDINASGYTQFFWNFGDGDTATTSGDHTKHAYDSTGIYNVSVTVYNGCGNSAIFSTTAYVVGNAPISNNFEVNPSIDPACPGDVVDFHVSSGGPSFSYYWNFGDGNVDTTIGSGANHSYAALGTYTVTLIGVNGCGTTKTVTTVVNIVNNAVPQFTWGGGDKNWGVPSDESVAGCPGDAILFFIIGNYPNNVWDFGDGYTGTATETMVLAADNSALNVMFIKHAYAASGNYTVKLTLTNGCGNSATDSTQITIGGNQLVSGGLYSSAPPSIGGFSTCTPIDFIAIGGSTFVYDFGDGNTLSTVSPMVTHTYATAGNYVASVVITNGCGNTGSYSLPINVSTSGGPTVNVLSNISPTCEGGSNGSASVNASTGQSPFSYMWNDANMQATQLATGLSTGSYLATITDALGCASTITVSISNPAPINLSSSSTQATCGVSDGTATISITSGGTSPFSYVWSSGATSATASSLGWGPVSVTVTDANGCTSSGNVSISENGAPTLAVGSVTNATCYGGNNGNININVTGGNPPYTYAWSNGSTLQDPPALTAGNYSVLVTDGGGCKATLNTTVGQGVQIIVATSVGISPTCGNFDGSASASASGGNSPYTYLWPSAGNQTTQTATGLPAGTYSCTVTDAIGCTSVGVVALSNSNAPSVTATVTDVSCFGGSNGAIDLNVSGGTSPYLYTWNVGPPQTNNQDLNTLFPGTYFVSVKDAKNCYSYRLYAVTQPSLLAGTTTNTGATCNNNDGTATANPTGGTAPYTYVWNSAPAQSTQTAINLALGNYTVAVTDSKGCVTASTASISATTLPVTLCEVTVDSLSMHNVVVWDKPVVSNIDSFRVYRLAGFTWVHIGSVHYSNLSYYTDTVTGIDPNVQSYKYKVSAVDLCGGESTLSPHHKTMHNTASIGVGGVVNLIWDQYEGFTSAYYRIWRDSTGVNPQLKDSTIWGNLTWTDINPPTVLDTVAYWIEVVTPYTCSASIKNPNTMASSFNSSKSNVFKVWDTTVVSTGTLIDESSILIYPNPSNGLFSIEISKNPAPAIVKIYNMLGEEVLSQKIIGKAEFNMRNIAKGVYNIKITIGDRIIHKKIITQ